MKHLSHDSLYPGRDLNPEPPEYVAGVLTTRPGRSVRKKSKLESEAVVKPCT
jgi:hypothetical protein